VRSGELNHKRNFFVLLVFLLLGLPIIIAAIALPTERDAHAAVTERDALRSILAKTSEREQAAYVAGVEHGSKGNRTADARALSRMTDEILALRLAIDDMKWTLVEQGKRKPK